MNSSVSEASEMATRRSDRSSLAEMVCGREHETSVRLSDRIRMHLPLPCIELKDAGLHSLSQLSLNVLSLPGHLDVGFCSPPGLIAAAAPRAPWKSCCGSLFD